jgi:2-oxoglutarate ferredoxin oxidoreductase subunit alpha
VVALYPTDPSECYTLTIEAFNLAEELRAPVFLVMDKELSMTRERVDLSRLEKPAVIDRSAPVPHDYAISPDEPFQSYAFLDPGDVPPFSAIGGERITRYTTSTHDHQGRLTTDPAIVQRFIDHLVSKIEKRKDRLCRVSADLADGADLLVISFGITARSAREAVKMARERGSRVSHLMIHSIWPVPETAIRSAARGVRRVVVPELNTGQYVLEVQRVIGSGAEVVGVHKMDTTLLSPEAILDRLI